MSTFDEIQSYRVVISKFIDFILYLPVKVRKEITQIQVSNTVFEKFKKYYSADQYFFIAQIEVLPAAIEDNHIRLITSKGTLTAEVNDPQAFLSIYQ